ncbi:MAG: D-hexose-6-phosphate mutarotase [Cellulomonas sp.]|uniref:D-hexose-6-phosphate mutarotase n=1 Tax=Cellulomonas sp. TaxID=40001 RepID=UPI0017C38E9B|nr:D-hexose-6-phosphate mutarotase [Cellulomonas sp.]NMM16280.1 D-hexose-6-phosphate mutarotase [Cellulomonas sp.]NMM31480.1 D-hexose-6-phosphate mutarotase [Cellulomonas sp.]
MSTLPPSVRLETGRGGLPVLRVSALAATAEIYLHGAHVTSWVPMGQRPVVWLSAASRFDADSAIRGGVPICFPWFGARAGHPEGPQHGFARLSHWELVDTRDQGDEVVVQLRLTDSEATRASDWPYMFAATFTVVVGAQLSMTLEVMNRDTTEFTFEEALHTYLAVGDVRATEVSGLEGTPYVDRPTGPDPVPGEPGTARFTDLTDRIYLATAARTTVRDVAGGRAIGISKDGSDSTVVWNPWVDNARAMADFGDDEWTGMICVETCNVRDDSVLLEPDQSHSMTARLEVSALSTP